jgi:hypothetical protein
MAEGFVLNISADIDAFMERAYRVEKDNLPFVTAYALTKTAQDIKDEEVTVMARVFDRPTRFTLNSLYVKRATKQDLTAAVMFKEGFGSVPAWHYLGPQVEGGSRVKKSFERALQRAGIIQADEYCMPAKGVALDSYGNLSGSTITQMLSSLGANPDPLSNTTARSKKRNPNRGAFFVLRGVQGAPDGIYLRTGGRKASPFLIFTGRPHYRKKLPFYEIARQVFQANFAKHFRIGMVTYGNSRSRAA